MVDLSIELPKGFLDEEPKTLVVPRWRKEVWAVTLDLLVEFDRVCRRNGIRYFCDGGTLLGAIRHKGFVPWDDDIDVVMSRGEYARLDAIAPNEFKYPYFWQTNATDPGSARGHAQLRNSKTTAILKSEMRDGKSIYSFNQGIFIDVFPFDNVPDDADERLRFKEKLAKIQARAYRIKAGRIATHSFKSILSPRGLYRFARNMAIRAGERIFHKDYLSQAMQELEQSAQEFNGRKTAEMAPVSFRPFHRETLPSHFFDEAIEVDFEFLKIPVMAHYREALAINYGNWQEHVIGASAHGGLFVDTSRPYTEYLVK